MLNTLSLLKPDRMNRGRGAPNEQVQAGGQPQSIASNRGANRANSFQAAPSRGGANTRRGFQRTSPGNLTPPTAPSSSGSSPERFWNIVQAPRNRRRPLPKFDLKHEDNAGEVAWRQRERPKAGVRIPEDLVIALTEYYDIAQRYHVFLLREQVKGESGSISFAIWGGEDAVAACKSAIERWVQQHARSKAASGASSHPKVVSLTPKQREMEARYWDNELKQQRYRQNPPIDKEFEVMGAFLWPVDEYRPDEILGSSYEALDTIRTESSCYITFNKERRIFQVYGDEENVKNALARIRKTCFQVTAHQLPTVHSYLLRWPQDIAFLPQGVMLESYYRPITVPPPTTGTSEPSYMPRSSGASPGQGMSSMVLEATAGNVESARTQVMGVLRRLHFYRGNIQLRVRLGTFLLVQYKKTENGLYQLPEYKDMVKQSKFSGKTTQE